MTFRTLAALVAVSVLTACGGGGGGGKSTDGGPAGPAAPLDRIRTLTGAAAPAETTAAQNARARGIVKRTDSLVSSAVYGKTSSRLLPTFVFETLCTDNNDCTYRDETIRVQKTVHPSDLEFVSGVQEPVGTRNGVTLIRATGADFGSLGAWLDHSAFAVQMERFTILGVRVDTRRGLASGDLTGAALSGDAVWQGLMVGTPAIGPDSGDRLQGDAALTYDIETSLLDAEFTGIQNIDRLRAHAVSAVRFSGLSVDAGGTFEDGGTGNRIQGGFYGPGHAEAAGVFEHSNIVGAFGAKRKQPDQTQ